MASPSRRGQPGGRRQHRHRDDQRRAQRRSRERGAGVGRDARRIERREEGAHVGAGNTTLTFDAPGISDQTATGTISLKLAGAGWSKAFTGTNLAAYKSNNVAGPAAICGWMTPRQGGALRGVRDDVRDQCRQRDQSDRSASAPGDLNDYGSYRNSANEMYLARAYTSVGSAAQAYNAFGLLMPSTSVGFASGNGPMPYPNGPDSGLYLTRHYVFESAYNALRGLSPGLYCCPQNLPLGLFTAHTRIAAVDNLVGKDLRADPFGAGVTTAAFVFFDATGPWR
jgi:hypothetical protein